MVIRKVINMSFSTRWFMVLPTAVTVTLDAKSIEENYLEGIRD